MGNFHKWKHGLGLPVFIAVFSAAAAIVMLLWNALLPAIIGWSVITFWQACGLLLLCRLLFGGFGKMGCRHHMGGPGASRKQMGRMDEVREQMRGMSHEERRVFIQNRMKEFHAGNCEPQTKQESAE